MPNRSWYGPVTTCQIGDQLQINLNFKWLLKDSHKIIIINKSENFKSSLILWDFISVTGSPYHHLHKLFISSRRTKGLHFQGFSFFPWFLSLSSNKIKSSISIAWPWVFPYMTWIPIIWSRCSIALDKFSMIVSPPTI